MEERYTVRFGDETMRLLKRLPRGERSTFIRNAVEEAAQQISRPASQPRAAPQELDRIEQQLHAYVEQQQAQAQQLAQQLQMLGQIFEQWNARLDNLEQKLSQLDRLEQLLQRQNSLLQQFIAGSTTEPVSALDDKPQLSRASADGLMRMIQNLGGGKTNANRRNNSY